MASRWASWRSASDQRAIATPSAAATSSATTAEIDGHPRDHLAVVLGDEHQPRDGDHAGEHRADGHTDHQHQLPEERRLPDRPGDRQADDADAQRARGRDQDDLDLVAGHDAASQR